jgi:uncharacterized protein (DUF58 family)
MHWRNTARTGRPTVRQYETLNGNATLLVVDASNVQGQPGETTLDYGARIIGSVARTLTRSGAEVELLADARRIHATRDWRTIMKSLALLKGTSGPSVAGRLGKLTESGTVFGVVWARDAATVSALAQLCRRGTAVATVVLEGFAPGDEAGSAASLLRNAGAAVSVCRQGAIEEAIQAIEQDDDFVRLGVGTRSSTFGQTTDLAA